MVCAKASINKSANNISNYANEIITLDRNPWPFLAFWDNWGASDHHHHTQNTCSEEGVQLKHASWKKSKWKWK